MAKTKRESGEIDEAALLMSIYERDNEVQPTVRNKPAEPESVPEPPEFPDISKKEKEAKEPAKRRRSQPDYSGLFLQRNELKSRSCVYISQRIHSTVTEIVRVIADRNVTVGGYIDNVLLQHLETYRDEINQMYKRERKDLIEL